MTKMKLAAWLVLLVSAAFLTPQASAETPVLQVGTKAPPLELSAADGSSRSLAEIDGPKVLIFFRGLW